ncbi:UNVERIFIED_CONTAM: (-)-alpha-terpineol synthase [Sesamum radiatum]|uniref:(-)-alpha-terpineol synthase n=1 Tax=Sesamum radiatum TaxID=300843 RepID=A0AAW2RW36_SESRA
MLVQEKQVWSVEELLEVIDELQRVGICYHFEDEINQILGCLYEKKYAVGKNNSDSERKERDLYTTALEFRLLRQHGFIVSQGETTLDLAREFATNFLQKYPNKKIDANLSLLVRHALELPIHWRVQRPNARWFIEAYERKSDVNSLVLQLARLNLNIVQRPNATTFIDAYERRSDVNSLVLELTKLDFNIVQAIHREELKHLSSWWKQTCIAEKLPFARDRLVEAYTWSSGYLPRPEHGYARIMATKVNTLTTVLDDIYDVYGTLEELQLFTDAFQRWDTEAIEKLPEYMQICYLAAYNVVNEMAYDVLTQQGFLSIPHLRKSVIYTGLTFTPN